MVRLRVVPSFERLEREFFRLTSQEINEALEIGKERIVGASPVGVSPLGQSLRGNWVVQPIQLLTNDRGVIRNSVQDALQRVVGSPSGTRVDPRPGTPLFRWARSKGIPAKVVAQSIFARGTERWRTGRNPIGLDDRGDWQNENAGLPGRITLDIRRRIARLRL